MLRLTPRQPLFYITPKEVFNSYSHIAAAIFYLGVAVLLTKITTATGDVLLLGATVIYGFGVFFIYFASAFYHLAYHPRLKAAARIVDHYGIFISAAATYTPMLLITFGKHKWAVALCITFWLLAAVGIYLETVLGINNYRDNRKKSFTVIMLIAVLCLALLPVLFTTYGPLPLVLYFGGIIFSMIGFICYRRSKKYPRRDVLYHGLWHVWGFLSSFAFLLFYYQTLYRYFY